MNKKGYQFDFFVEQLTEEQAGALMDIVIAFAEGFDTYVGSGGYPVEEKKKPDFLADLDRRLERKSQEQPNGKD